MSTGAATQNLFDPRVIDLLGEWRNKDILLLPIVNYGSQKFAYHNICRHQETFH